MFILSVMLLLYSSSLLRVRMDDTGNLVDADQVQVARRDRVQEDKTG